MGEGKEEGMDDGANIWNRNRGFSLPGKPVTTRAVVLSAASSNEKKKRIENQEHSGSLKKKYKK